MGKGMPEQVNTELLNRRISGWLRQSRYRCRQLQLPIDLSYQDVLNIYQAYDHKCAYCGNIADSPDHPFPIKEKGPCTQANVVPCCNDCRAKKKNKNIIRFSMDGHITEAKLHEVVKKMVSFKGGNELKVYIRTVYTGK